MNSAFFAVQDALYDALTADAGLRALLGVPTRIYDHVPPDATFPFLTLGTMQADAFDTADHGGASHRVTFHLWSRARGLKEVKTIMDALYQRLHHGALTVSGQQVLLCRFVSSATQLDDDGLTYHGLAQYQLITQSA